MPIPFVSGVSGGEALWVWWSRASAGRLAGPATLGPGSAVPQQARTERGLQTWQLHWLSGVRTVEQMGGEQISCEVGRVLRRPFGARRVASWSCGDLGDGGFGCLQP